MSLAHRAIKNGAFSIVSQITSLVLGLLFAGMTIRYLGTARAGFFMVAGLILGWFGMTGMGGFRAAAVQRLAALSAVRDWGTSRAVLGTVLTANLALSLPFAVISVAAFPYLFTWSRLDAVYRHDAWCVVALGALSFMIDQWAGTLRGLYGAHQRFDLGTYTGFGFGLFGNLARLFVLVQYTTMASVALVNVAVSSVWLAVDLVLTRKMLSGWVLPVWRHAELRPLMRFGAWAWSGDIIGAVASNLGNLVTTYFLGSAPLPYLTLPQRIVTQVHLFVASCCYFLFPTLAAESNASDNVIARVEDRLRWFVGATTWAVYAALVVAGPQLLSLMAGADFARHAYPPLVMFCVLFAINGQNIVYTYASMAVGRIHPSVVCENSASLLTVASNFILIPWLGYMGACWAAMWKVPCIMVQCLWSRRVLGLPTTLRTEWGPYLSPLAGVLVWGGVAVLSRVFCSHTPYLVLAGSLWCGAAAYLLTVWYLETHVLAKHARWAMVLTLVDFVRSRARNRVTQ
jgi:O-antigen/teichoic acid export membrane protein